MPVSGYVETYDHTNSGPLRKRADLFNEAILIRERLAESRNDIEALDRTLGTLGYKGDLDAAMPRQKRQVIFGQGELTRAIVAELRDADGPMASRQVAQSIIALQGHDARQGPEIRLRPHQAGLEGPAEAEKRRPGQIGDRRTRQCRLVKAKWD